MPPPPIGPPRLSAGSTSTVPQGVLRPPPPKMLPSASTGSHPTPGSRPQSPSGRPGMPSAPPPQPPHHRTLSPSGDQAPYSGPPSRPQPPPAPQNVFAGNGSTTLSPPPPAKVAPGPPTSRPAPPPAASSSEIAAASSYDGVSNDSIAVPRTPNPSFASPVEAQQTHATSIPPEAANNSYSQQSSAAPSANLRSVPLQEQLESLRLDDSSAPPRRNSIPPSATAQVPPQPQSPPPNTSGTQAGLQSSIAPNASDNQQSATRRVSAPPSAPPSRVPVPQQQQQSIQQHTFTASASNFPSSTQSRVAPPLLNQQQSVTSYTQNFVLDSDMFNAEAEARAQQAMRKNALEIVDDICPFSQREHKVQVLYEISGGLNYAEIERLRQARSSVPRIMAALARKEIFEALGEITNNMINGNDGLRVEQQDVWVQLRPGQLQSAFLNFDASGGTVSLTDADWPIRVYVAVRCQYEDANDIAMALQCFAEEPDAFAQVAKVYQQHTRRLVSAMVNVIDMASPSTVVGVRDPGARGRTSLTTVLPNANSPFRSTTPTQTYRAQTPTRGGSMNVHMVGVGTARAVADDIDGRVYVIRGSSQPATSAASSTTGMTGRGVSPNRSIGTRGAVLASGNQPTTAPDAETAGGGGGGGEEYFLKVSELPRYTR